MILFLIIAIAIYSFINVFGVVAHPIATTHSSDIGQETNLGQKSTSSSGLALLIQYTIQLSNYLLYFVMSIW